VTDFVAEIAATMNASMDTEDRRRLLASQMPGYGAQLQLPDNSVGLNVGKSGLLPTVGEGHSVVAEISEAVHKSFGAPRPQYAHPIVGGENYSPGGVATALRAVGERVFGAQDAAGRAGVTIVSPEAAPRPSLLGRLFGKLRRR
jgi:hypothetical protein